MSDHAGRTIYADVETEEIISAETLPVLDQQFRIASDLLRPDDLIQSNKSGTPSTELLDRLSYLVEGFIGISRALHGVPVGIARQK
jgi:hypothetical protein